MDLAEVVLAYVEHVERTGDMDLEATTEFLVLIAALLFLKSKLLLPGEGHEQAEPDRGEAVDELLARMVEYARYRGVAAELGRTLEREQGFRYRSAPLPPHLRRVSLEGASKAYEPAMLARAVGDLLRAPEPLDLRHVTPRSVPIEQRLSLLRTLLATRGRFRFDEAVGGADRLTEAVTLFALLELYKAGEADWEQSEPFGEISVRRR